MKATIVFVVCVLLVTNVCALDLRKRMLLKPAALVEEHASAPPAEYKPGATIDVTTASYPAVKCIQGKCGEWAKDGKKYLGCYEFRAATVQEDKRFTCAGSEMPRATTVAALQSGRVFVANAEKGGTIVDSDQCGYLKKDGSTWKNLKTGAAVGSDAEFAYLPETGQGANDVTYKDVTNKFWTDPLNGCSMSAVVGDTISVGHISSDGSKVRTTLEADKTTATRHQIVFPNAIPDATSNPLGSTVHIWGQKAGKDLEMFVGIINIASPEQMAFLQNPNAAEWAAKAGVYAECKKVTLKPASFGASIAQQLA